MSKLKNVLAGLGAFAVIGIFLLGLPLLVTAVAVYQFGLAGRYWSAPFLATALLGLVVMTIYTEREKREAARRWQAEWGPELERRAKAAQDADDAGGADHSLDDEPEPAECPVVARLLEPPLEPEWLIQSWDNELAARWAARDSTDELTSKCADLPEGLEHLGREAEADEFFAEDYAQWREFVDIHDLEVLVEQCCDETGKMLPHELRMQRTYSAPPEWKPAMRELLAGASAQVLAYLCLRVSLEVRMARARATGNPEWRPHEAEPPEPEPAFRASRFKPRPYAR